MLHLFLAKNLPANAGQKFFILTKSSLSTISFIGQAFGAVFEKSNSSSPSFFPVLPSRSFILGLFSLLFIYGYLQASSSCSEWGCSSLPCVGFSLGVFSCREARVCVLQHRQASEHTGFSSSGTQAWLLRHM